MAFASTAASTFDFFTLTTFIAPSDFQPLLHSMLDPLSLLFAIIFDALTLIFSNFAHDPSLLSSPLCYNLFDFSVGNITDFQELEVDDPVMPVCIIDSWFCYASILPNHRKIMKFDEEVW